MGPGVVDVARLNPLHPRWQTRAGGGPGAGALMGCSDNWARQVPSVGSSPIAGWPVRGLRKAFPERISCLPLRDRGAWPDSRSTLARSSGALAPLAPSRGPPDRRAERKTNPVLRFRSTEESRATGTERGAVRSFYKGAADTVLHSPGTGRTPFSRNVPPNEGNLTTGH